MTLPSPELDSQGASPDMPILTVSQATNAIKHCLESTFPLIWLQGEISNFKPHTSGHFYFSLKDANAQISAVMFRPDASLVKIVPKDGAQVIVKGEINVFPAGGRYQILVRELRPVGLGELLLKLEELKIKLHKLGWFKTDRKKPLPKFPKTIGVITSQTGAALQDILNILTRRFSGFHLILNPVKVQGEGAAKEIAKAIDQFNAYNLVDVMIVGRGGGSIEDLWAFNEEILAEAIYKSHIPIISAVGHETDHCIADYVADVRAPTPSAAAEIVIAEKSQQLHHLSQLKMRMQQSAISLIRQDKQRLQGIKRHPIFQTPFGLLAPWVQRLDTSRHYIDESIAKELQKQKILLESRKQMLISLNPAARLQHYQQKLCSLEKSIHITITRQIQFFEASLKNKIVSLDKSWVSHQKERLAALQSDLKRRQLDSYCQRNLADKKELLRQMIESLHAVNPKNVLQKGYCIIYSNLDNHAISSVEDVSLNDQIKVQLSDGELITVVSDIRKINR